MTIIKTIMNLYVNSPERRIIRNIAQKADKLLMPITLKARPVTAQPEIRKTPILYEISIPVEKHTFMQNMGNRI